MANPNATAAAGSGLTATLVVWLAGYVGLDLGAEEGALVATAIAAVVLAIGRDGVAGLARKFWRGGSK